MKNSYFFTDNGEINYTKILKKFGEQTLGKYMILDHLNTCNYPLFYFRWV